MRAHFTCLCASMALVVAGCSLDRVSLGGQGVDSGPDIDSGPAPDDGGRPDSGEGGAECTPGSCDDGNVCTNDTCDPRTGCVFAPVPGSCDDGVLCNGGDSCMNGTCSAHDGIDPCAGSSTCDVGTDSCVGCIVDTDCPAVMTGDFGACEFTSGDVCTTTGTQTRSVTSYVCNGEGTCDAVVASEAQACTRPSTDGTSCGDDVVSPWSECMFQTTCGITGTRTRTVATPVCSAGACNITPIMQSEVCTRASTDGAPCGTRSCDPAWGPCLVETECTGNGLQLRACTTPTCSGGTCAMTTDVETQACTSGPGLSCVDSSVCGLCHSPGQLRCTGTYGVMDCTYTVGTCNGGNNCMSPGPSMVATLPCRCP